MYLQRKTLNNNYLITVTLKLDGQEELEYVYTL